MRGIDLVTESGGDRGGGVGSFPAHLSSLAAARADSRASRADWAACVLYFPPCHIIISSP